MHDTHMTIAVKMPFALKIIISFSVLSPQVEFTEISGHPLWNDLDFHEHADILKS